MPVGSPKASHTQKKSSSPGAHVSKLDPRTPNGAQPHTLYEDLATESENQVSVVGRTSVPRRVRAKVATGCVANRAAAWRQNVVPAHGYIDPTTNERVDLALTESLNRIATGVSPLAGVWGGERRGREGRRGRESHLSNESVGQMVSVLSPRAMLDAARWVLEEPPTGGGNSRSQRRQAAGPRSSLQQWQ